MCTLSRVMAQSRDIVVPACRADSPQDGVCPTSVVCRPVGDDGFLRSTPSGGLEWWILGATTPKKVFEPVAAPVRELLALQPASNRLPPPKFFVAVAGTPPDSQYIVGWSSSGTTWKLLLPFPLVPSSLCAWGTDGRFCTCVCEGSPKLFVWDVRTGLVVSVVKQEDDRGSVFPRSALFLSETVLWTVWSNRRVGVCDTASQLRRWYDAPFVPSRLSSFHLVGSTPYPTILALNCLGETGIARPILFWIEPPDGRMAVESFPRTKEEGGSAVACVAISKFDEPSSPDFVWGVDVVVLGHTDGSLTFWRPPGRACRSSPVHSHEKHVWWLRGLPGHQCVSSALDGTVKIWNCQTGTCLRTCSGFDAPVCECLRVTPTSVLLAQTNGKVMTVSDHCSLSPEVGAHDSVKKDDTEVETPPRLYNTRLRAKRVREMRD